LVVATLLFVAISNSVTKSSILSSLLHNLQRKMYTGGVRAISSPVETRFGSYHFVLRDIVHSKEALQRLTTTDDWEQAVRGSNSLAAAHTAPHALGDDSLWVVCTKVVCTSGGVHQPVGGDADGTMGRCNMQGFVSYDPWKAWSIEHCMRIVIIRVDSRVRNVHTELHDFRDLD
jgi:hypothetical protein